jgi:hypothetical protein
VQFRDGQSHLFDVEQVTVSDPFVVPARQEHAFRMSLGKLTWTNEVVTASARVQAASDGTRPSPTD